jgi:hypothetical protein
VRTRPLLLAILTAAILVLAPPRAAEAQHWHGGFSISVGFGYGVPVYWFHPSWFYGYPYRPFGYPGFWGPYYPSPYYPYPHYPGTPYSPYALDGFSVSLRLDTQPIDAQVYVDGNRAGIVDNYDGVFQRLHLRAGEHEIVVYRDGYETIRERRYFNPGSSQTIRQTMRPLAPGEVAEAPPALPPSTPPENRDQSRVPPPQPPPVPPVEEPAPVFGTLSIRMQPADAEVLIDGDRWPGTASQMPIAIQLTAGRHKIEIRKDGYQPYVQDVLIRRDRALTLNVNLTRR